MAIDKYIPRLEWNEITGLTGNTTILNNTVTGISSTAALREGMIIQGVGIPSGTRIVSKTLTSVTMSTDATATGSTVSLTFYERYDFQYPPTRDSEEKLKPQNKVTTSISGSQQVQTDHLEAERDLEFSFITKTDIDLLDEIFYKDFAIFGSEFRYFTDLADPVFNTYSLNNFNFQRDREVKKHPEFLYKTKFQFRRVIF
jgi:hypothetical protein